MSQATAILITLVIYKVALLAIGVAANRRTRNAADFLLGGRRLGPWVAALSASASSSSAWTLLGVSGFAYKFGLSAVWIFPACVGGFALNWYVLAPRLRRQSAESGALTLTDFIAGPRDGPGSRSIRLVATLIILASLVLYVASQFRGAGLTFAETFGIDLADSVLIGAAVVVAYTLLGGFWAVSVTDTLQGLIMALAAALVPISALVATGGWPDLDAVGVPGFSSLTRNAGAPAAFGLVLGLLGIGLGYPGQPHVVNRFMALRDADSVAPARRIAMAWAVVIYTGMISLGLCGRVLYPALGDAEAVFITATTDLFPPLVAGALLAAVLSAIMSTADSQLLVAAGAVSHDVSGGGSLRWSRVWVLILSAVAVGVALLADASIWSRVLFAWTAMGAAFGPLLVVLLVWGPVSPRYRLAAMVVGFVAAVVAYSIPEARGTAWERVTPFLLAFAVALRGRKFP